MGLDNLLADHRSEIITAWFSEVVDTYPTDTAKFLKRQKDPFANPVGATVKKGLEEIFDHLLAGLEVPVASAILDPMIRIRAIQNFSPSRAIGFLFALKAVVRREIQQHPSQRPAAEEFSAFENAVDQMGLIAFDVYMKCREKLYEIQANEIRNSTFKAFKRAGLIREIPDKEPDLR
jgi:hypothetical protein